MTADKNKTLDEDGKIQLGFICEECQKTLYEGDNPPGHPQMCDECRENRDDLIQI